MAKIRVGVLRGGPSAEYEISLKTGENILANLPQEKYAPVDIFISKDGMWHWKGLPTNPEKILRNIDVIFNAMHGEYGEDGEVQKLLDAHRVPYTGSDMLASRVAMKKNISREIFKQHGLNVLPAYIIREKQSLIETSHAIIRQIAPPWIVKPNARGSSVGISISSNIYELIPAIERAFSCDTSVIVEQYKKGREATCGILENFRDETHYALPVIEIIPPPHKKFFDYECKYDGSTREICPGRFDSETTKHIQEAAKTAHTILGCRHYSRSDFIVARDGIWILETNTLPGFTAESLLPKSTEAIGLPFPLLLDHIVTLALADK